MVIIPFILLGGAEAAQRLAGYGYRTSLFKKLQIGNGEFFVNNDDFSLRFFPPQLARFPGPIRMTANKPAGTHRIFILGESAAMGDPEPAYAAGWYLEALPSARYPKTHFEIVNLGRAWAEQVEKMLPVGISHAARANVWAAQETCDHLLALTDWNRGSVTEMLARLGQFDDALREFQEALRLEPGNQPAQEYSERVKDWKNQRHQ